MSQDSSLVIDRPVDGVARVRIDREGQLNALTIGTLASLRARLLELDADDDVRCVVLTGTGRAFSAGLDLDVIGSALATVDPASGQDLQEHAVELLLTPRDLAKPVIAAVNGLAVGGGFALALACDLRIAATSASFTVGTPRLGLSGCDVGMSWLLPRLVGASVAFDLMLTSRTVGGEEAMAQGLVSRLVADDALEAGSLAAATTIASLAPHAVRLTKEAMWANLEGASFSQARSLENRNQVLTLMTRDCAEGVDALRERRAPSFQGR